MTRTPLGLSLRKAARGCGNVLVLSYFRSAAMNLQIESLLHGMKRLLGFALIGISGLSVHAAQDSFTVAADPWCPFNCTPNSSRPGYMVELLTLILKPHGYSVRYKILPWNRAVANAESGEIDGVLAAGEEDATKLLLHKTPIGMSAQAYAVRRGDEFDWTDANSLGSRRLEIIKGYDYGPDVMGWIERNPRQTELSYGETPLQSGLKKLLARRSDVVVNNISVLRYTLKDLDLSEAFTVRPTGKQVPLFIGLSPKNPQTKRLAGLLDEGITRLRKSGELKAVMAAYGLTDWQ